jgi:hypothetical protein
MKSTENKKALKYRVAEDYTREYIADAMKDYNKYHSFYINNERYFIFDFAFNNKELKKKFGDDFDILTSGGGSGSLYYGATNSAKKGTKIREGSTYCYIVKHGANPGTGEGWRFDTSFYAKEGWKVEKFYFDQEGTDADRETWEKGWIKGFAIEILE